MRANKLFTELLLFVACIQNIWGQGYKVYKNDGVVVPFSTEQTDSIVFSEDINGNTDFGPYTVANQMIAGKWYISKSETVTFYLDGKTDYIEGGTYEFLPFQGIVIIYNSANVPYEIINIHKVAKERLIVSNLGSNTFRYFTHTQPVQLVTSIVLSENSVELKIDGIATLIATVLPNDADNKDIAWESSDDDVAEVNKNGRVIANGYGTCNIICSAKDGSGVQAVCVVTVKDETHGSDDDHEWVDLGLTSGTLWAATNIGADKPEDYGSYFAWGETETKSGYNWGNYKWAMGSWNSITKYCTSAEYGIIDNKTTLDPEDDAATVNWGGSWRIPSRKEWEELSKECSWTWTSYNGHYGFRVTGSNQKAIFLPAAGKKLGPSGTNLIVGEAGMYWANSLNPEVNEDAYSGLFWKDGFSDYYVDYGRCEGLSIRPVRIRTR